MKSTSTTLRMHLNTVSVWRHFVNDRVLPLSLVVARRLNCFSLSFQNGANMCDLQGQSNPIHTILTYVLTVRPADNRSYDYKPCSCWAIAGMLFAWQKSLNVLYGFSCSLQGIWDATLTHRVSGACSSSGIVNGHWRASASRDEVVVLQQNWCLFIKECSSHLYAYLWTLKLHTA